MGDLRVKILHSFGSDETLENPWKGEQTTIEETKQTAKEEHIHLQVMNKTLQALYRFYWMFL